MITFEVRAADFEDHSPLLLVGFAEAEDGDGRSFIFKCDLRMNEYEEGSNWPEGESYCVSTEGGLTHYGCVREVRVQGSRVIVYFTGEAVRDLHLQDSEIEFQLDIDEAGIGQIVEGLEKILTCGRPEYHPRLVGF